MGRELTIWRVEPFVFPKRTAATTATASTDGQYLPTQRMGDVPVFVRSIYDNPELLYVDPEPLLLRWPIPNVGVNFPFNNPPGAEYPRDFRRAYQVVRDILLERPHWIYEEPPPVVDPPLRKEAFDDFNVIRYQKIQVQQRALRVVQENANPWDIPGSSFGVSSCELLNEIQKHFLEPVVDNGLSWQLWTAGEVRAFLNLRIQRFLIETGIVRKEAVISVSAGQVSVEMPSDLMEIRKVDFYNGTFINLPRLDELQADLGNPGWEAVNTVPEGYIEEPLPSLSIRLYPNPLSAGVVYVRYVPLPETVTAACTLLPIPRMFTWAIKWGVIADLLMKEGEANDPARAVAAEQQFTFGVNLARYVSGVEI